MKSYTDLNQSKKLAEILPLKSADFVWLIGYLHTDGPRYEVIRTKNEVSEPEKYWPCWSLVALLDVYPMVVGKDLDMYCCWQNSKNLHSRHYDNPIDACCEMILKLHEEKLL